MITSHVWCYFLQVEVLHDFEAANSDELNLKRGDIVLVIPSETTADQVKPGVFLLLTFIFVLLFFLQIIVNGNVYSQCHYCQKSQRFLSLNWVLRLNGTVGYSLSPRYMLLAGSNLSFFIRAFFYATL